MERAAKGDLLFAGWDFITMNRVGGNMRVSCFLHLAICVHWLMIAVD